MNSMINCENDKTNEQWTDNGIGTDGVAAVKKAWGERKGKLTIWIIQGKGDSLVVLFFFSQWS